MTYQTLVYKTIGDVKLDLRVFRPEDNVVPGASDHAPAFGARPAILFFVCGGWNGYVLDKVLAPATYFAARGAVVFTALVRVKPVHGTTPAECVIDAKSAVRWVRAHAAEYGVDPAKIICSGGSASGHVSACTALIDDFNDPADDLKISAKPNAVCAFCPVLVVYHSDGRIKIFGSAERARALSPILHVTAGAPPFLIQFGAEDSTVVPEEGMLFKREMDRVGARCELHTFHREGHGFQNYFDGKNPMFYITHRNMDRFLASLDFLKGSPTIDTFPFTDTMQNECLGG